MNSLTKILIIDDDTSACDTFEALLFNENYQLDFAYDGPTGIDKAVRLRPDLILLDVMMPGMNGFEVCKALKRKQELEHIPIIMITALDSKADVVYGLEAGADEFLPKPVIGAELRARIRSMLRIKKLYDGILATLRLREDLANMIVHDMKSPLSGVMGYCELLKIKSHDPETESFIDNLWRDAQRLNSYLTDMLMLTKMESGKPIMNPSVVDVRQFFQVVQKNHRLIAQAKRIDISWRLPDESRTILLDVNLFQRVMDNLISNALKFAPVDSQISIEIEFADSMMRVQIRDEGPGISDENRDRIFEKYEVVKLKRKGVPQVGLGLAFCKMAVEAHGGRIYVEPNQPKGSIFVIEIKTDKCNG